MTIIDVIENVDALLFNTYQWADKVRWLSTLDGKIKKTVIDTHEGSENVTFSGYDDNTPPDTELLVPEPFDDVYLYWLQAQIHYYDGENDKYNAAMIMFNSALNEYESYYNRTHMPLSRGRRFLF